MDSYPSEFQMPDRGIDNSTEEKVNEINFGDGVSQRVTIGLNYQKEVLGLKWSVLNVEKAKVMYEWLKERKNLTPFLFTNYKDVEKQYICTDLKFTDNSPSSCSMTATFKQDFNIY